MTGATTATEAGSPSRRTKSRRVRRALWVAVISVLLVGIVLGTKAVSSDDPLSHGNVQFDPASFGAENFPVVQEALLERAVDAQTLAAAIAADPAAAAEEYAVPSSGGPVFSVRLTGVVGKTESGFSSVAVAGMPETVVVRVQTGPAINGTELRDATGDIVFGQFTNQIEFQNAAAALNDELKSTVLAEVDAPALAGREIELVGAFTLINPDAWLVTPVQIDVR